MNILDIIEALNEAGTRWSFQQQHKEYFCTNFDNPAFGVRFSRTSAAKTNPIEMSLAMFREFSGYESDKAMPLSLVPFLFFSFLFFSPKRVKNDSRPRETTCALASCPHQDPDNHHLNEHGRDTNCYDNNDDNNNNRRRKK